MEVLVASGIGVLVASGVFLLLRARTFDVVIGLTLISYAVNAFILVMGRLTVGAPPIVRPGIAPRLAGHADPLPQALVLTAIVIGFGLTALLIVIAFVSRAENGSDHVDAREPDPTAEAS
jgi:multicomponent K+:H+ antiporter subunit C